MVGDDNLVLRTTDQGNTWREVRPPGPSDQLIYAHFPEPSVGYIGGLQTVWQTTDAGQSWRTVAGGDRAERPPADPLGFSFPTRNVGILVGLHGQIFRTDDGGANWSQQNSRTRAALRDVYFLDPNVGYIVGDSGTLLHTTNGGDTWNAVNAGTHLNLWSVQFMDRSMGLAVGEGGAILRTTTGGLAVRNLPPAVLSVSPQDHQTNVAADERVRIVFDADIRFNPGDYSSGKVQLRGPDGALVEAGAAYDLSTRELVILRCGPSRSELRTRSACRWAGSWTSMGAASRLRWPRRSRRRAASFSGRRFAGSSRPSRASARDWDARRAPIGRSRRRRSFLSAATSCGAPILA